MSTDLPQRTKSTYPASPEDLRTSSIFRISDELQVSYAEAETVYDRLLEKIRRALDNS